MRLEADDADLGPFGDTPIAEWQVVPKQTPMPTLTCKGVQFYSHADEAAFFHFAEHIKAVRRVEGVGDSILLYVSSQPSQQSLRDLIALFQRYRISGMSQLVSFLTEENRAWFGDPRKFWHRKVFGAEQIFSVGLDRRTEPPLTMECAQE